MMRKRLWFSVGATVCLLALPTVAHAQSSIFGTVKDTSGGVLPGVSVEVSSPVLIEGSKTATTDGGGTYRIMSDNPAVSDFDAADGEMHVVGRVIWIGRRI